MVKLIAAFNTIEHPDGNDEMTVYLELETEAPTAMEIRASDFIRDAIGAAMAALREQIMVPDGLHIYATGNSAEALAKARGVIPS